MRPARNPLVNGSTSSLAGPLGFAILIALAVAPRSVAQERENDPQRPNVLLIIGDDQTWTDYGFTGHPHIRTPNLDRLAAESRSYSRGYVPTSLCSPSLATILSGLYPHQHGITGNDPPAVEGKPRGGRNNDPEYLRRRGEMIAKFEQMPSLARILGEQGYLSLQTGKWWGGRYDRGGFTHGMTHGDPERGGRHGDAGLTIGRQGIEPIRAFLDLAEEEDRPFLIWYAPFLPHRPHNPPERLFEHYSQFTDSPHVARYWAMCEWFDETVGDVLGEIDGRGMAEDTIVVFVCDNGWIQQEGAGGYAPRSKRSPFDGGLRTPILVRWSGTVEPGFRDSAVSSIDIAPTVLEALGLPRDPRMPGVDLLDDEAVSSRDAIFGAIYTHDAIRIHDPAANLRYRWTIADGLKLIEPAPWNEPDEPVRLFDILADPFERMNLADDRPDAVERLTERLDAWWPAARDGATSGDASDATRE